MARNRLGSCKSRHSCFTVAQDETTTALPHASCNEVCGCRQRGVCNLLGRHQARREVEVPSMQSSGSRGLHAQKHLGAHSFGNGCTVCRVTMAQLLTEAKRPCTASIGLVCYVCLKHIQDGRECMKCPAPRHYCQARWHAELHVATTPPRLYIPAACEQLVFERLRMRKGFFIH